MATTVTGAAFSASTWAGDSLAKGGVYLTWAEDADGSRKKAVYVGRGKPAAACLARHRKEDAITLHQRPGRAPLVAR